MHTITFFANKGGSGRTIATMALASGFLSQGKRVAVMDCIDLAGGSADGRFRSTLQNWMVHMAACRFRPPQLELIECKTRDGVEDSAAAADARGIDILLVDTKARLEEPQLAALGLADLIIAPAISPVEAKCIVEGVSDYLGCPEHLLGLITGCRNGALEAAETRKAFRYHPVLQSELPWSEAISDQLLNGDIAHFVSSLACKPDKPGFARYRDALKAWVAVQKFTFEVAWALEGQRLEPFTGDQSPFAYKRKAVA
ncbi:division plane positioning ATPase MipZ [Yoonia sp. 2307UL14-13]|uniref:division plane positioning ATPase MipZ n=1 Tax=Yoonia sp. 2307UL14-13 TaxID=3126506 RepID=UPI00309E482F